MKNLEALSCTISPRAIDQSVSLAVSIQTCQLSRIARETHAFASNLTLSRLLQQISRIRWQLANVWVGPGNTALVLAAAASVFTRQPVNHVSVFFLLRSGTRSMDEQYSSDADSSDADSEHHGGLPGPSDPKKSKTGGKMGYSLSSRKWSGAAIYKTKFNTTWQQAWPFISPVKHDPHSFHCDVCMKKMSCGHQGDSVVWILLSTRKVLRPCRTPSHWVSYPPMPWIH